MIWLASLPLLLLADQAESDSSELLAALQDELKTIRENAAPVPRFDESNALADLDRIAPGCPSDWMRWRPTKLRRPTLLLPQCELEWMKTSGSVTTFKLKNATTRISLMRQLPSSKQIAMEDLKRLCDKHGIADEIETEVADRIRSYSEFEIMQLCLRALSENSEPSPQELPDALHDTVVGGLYVAFLNGSVCRKITAADRTFLLFSDNALRESRIIDLQVFEGGEPLYILQISRGRDSGPFGQLDMQILRSALDVVAVK